MLLPTAQIVADWDAAFAARIHCLMDTDPASYRAAWDINRQFLQGAARRVLEFSCLSLGSVRGRIGDTLEQLEGLSCYDCTRSRMAALPRIAFFALQASARNAPTSPYKHPWFWAI